MGVVVDEVPPVVLRLLMNRNANAPTMTSASTMMPSWVVSSGKLEVAAACMVYVPAVNVPDAGSVLDSPVGSLASTVTW